MSAMAPQGLPAPITIGGAGAGPTAGMPPAGVGMGNGQGADSGGQDDWEQDLQAALAALRELAADAEDHVEANVVDKCIAALSALTSKRQQGAESAFGVTPAHKAMSRQY